MKADKSKITVILWHILIPLSFFLLLNVFENGLEWPDRLHRISDGSFLSGLLFIMIGLFHLSWNLGIYDGLLFSFQLFFSKTTDYGKTDEPSSLSAFCEKRLMKKKSSKQWFFMGIGWLGFSLLFLILY